MLMDGPLSNSLDQDFYVARAAYLSELYQVGESEYNSMVIPEIEKMKTIPPGSKVYLWYEYDLFCQINLWSCCRWLQNHSKDLSLYWVTPGHEGGKGFGSVSSESLSSLSNTTAQRISKATLKEFALSLEKSSSKDYALLEAYIRDGQLTSRTKTVLEAQLRRMSNGEGPSQLEVWITKAIEDKGASFSEIFQLFSEDHSVYGMGDLQFRRVYDSLIN